MPHHAVLHQEEAQLLARAKAGDGSAFDVLVERYQDRIYNTVYRIVGHAEDAFDVTQEVFLKAFRALERYQARARFSTWLYRIAVNAAVSHRRRPWTREQTAAFAADGGPGEAPEPPDRAHGPDLRAEHEERDRALSDAVAALDDEFRVALVLRDIEGLSYEEIADLTEVPLGTVRSRLHRARRLLREQLHAWAP